MKLARKIVLFVLAAFLTLLGALGYFEARHAVREYDRHVTDDLAATGRAVRPSFNEVWRVEGEARALALLERTDAEIRSVHVAWIATPANDLAPDQMAALGRGDEVAQVRIGAPNDELRIYVPAFGGGAIVLSQPLVEERAVVLRVVEERLVAAVVAIVLTLVLSVLLGWGLVARPMKILVDQARRIGAGDL